MRKRTVTMFIASTSLLLLTLTGCSHALVDTKPNAGFGFAYTQIPVAPYLEDGFNMEQAALIQNDIKMVALLGGSSSCPPVIKTITKPTSTSIQINLKDYGMTACTVDYGMVAWEIGSIDGTYSLYDKTVEVCSGDNCIPLQIKSM